MAAGGAAYLLDLASALADDEADGAVGNEHAHVDVVGVVLEHGRVLHVAEDDRLGLLDGLGRAGDADEAGGALGNGVDVVGDADLGMEWGGGAYLGAGLVGDGADGDAVLADEAADGLGGNDDVGVEVGLLGDLELNGELGDDQLHGLLDGLDLAGDGQGAVGALGDDLVLVVELHGDAAVGLRGDAGGRNIPGSPGSRRRSCR